MRLLTVSLAAAVAYAALAAAELSDARAEIAVLKLKNEEAWRIIMTQGRRHVLARIRADKLKAPEPEPEPPCPLPACADPLDRLGCTYTLDELLGEVFGR